MSHQRYFIRQKPRLLLTLWWFTLSGPSYGPGLPLCLHNYYFKSSLMILFVMQTFQCVRCGHVCAHCMRVFVHPTVWLLPAGPPPFRWLSPPGVSWPLAVSGELLVAHSNLRQTVCEKLYLTITVSSGLSSELYKVSLTSLHGRFSVLGRTVSDQKSHPVLHIDRCTCTRVTFHSSVLIFLYMVLMNLLISTFFFLFMK